MVPSRKCSLETVRHLEAGLVARLEIDAGRNVTCHLRNAEIEIQLVPRSWKHPDAIRESCRNVKDRIPSLRAIKHVGMMWLLRRFRADNDRAFSRSFEYEGDGAKSARLPIGRVATHAPEFGVRAADAGTEHDRNRLGGNNLRCDHVNVAIGLACHRPCVFFYQTPTLRTSVRARNPAEIAGTHFVFA